MAKSERFDEILQLGQKIVDELGLDQTVDTLGRWMAHYIAELMVAAKAATGDELRSKQSVCARTIMALWAQRSAMPNGKRPFEDFEPIVHTLRSLDPNDSSPRYFRQALELEVNFEEDSKTKQWLGMASGIDCAARGLIRYSIGLAIESTEGDSAEWARLSKAIGDDDIDANVVTFLIENAKDLLNKDSKTVEVSRLKGLQARLDAFAAIASALSSEIRHRQASLS